MQKGEMFLDKNDNLLIVYAVGKNYIRLRPAEGGKSFTIEKNELGNYRQCITVHDEAKRQGCTADNLYKAIRRGSIKAYRKKIKHTFTQVVDVTIFPIT